MYNVVFIDKVYIDGIMYTLTMNTTLYIIPSMYNVVFIVKVYIDGIMYNVVFIVKVYIDGTMYNVVFIDKVYIYGTGYPFERYVGWTEIFNIRRVSPFY